MREIETISITQVHPPSLTSFFNLQMRTPNPTLGLASIAEAARGAGYHCTPIDAVGGVIDGISPYPDFENLTIPGMTGDEIIDWEHRGNLILAICSSIRGPGVRRASAVYQTS